MRSLIAALKALIGIVAIVCSSFAYAEQFKQFDDVFIHYQAVNTKLVDADSLQKYGIQVSRNNALINIAVQQKMPDGSMKPLAVTLKGDAKNLMQQKTELQFAEVKEGSAIYYLAQLRYTPEQTFHIEIDATLADGRHYQFSFPQTFYVEDGK